MSAHTIPIDLDVKSIPINIQAKSITVNYNVPVFIVAWPADVGPSPTDYVYTQNGSVVTITSAPYIQTGSITTIV